MVGKLIRSLQYCFKYLLSRRLKSIFYRFKYLLRSNPTLNSENRKHKVIISLTTYGRRINNVDLTIRSLFDQTHKADVIILNLAESEFSPNTIPRSLQALKNHGLIINYTADTRSYKKLIPTLSLYPNDFIITVDDDVLYPTFLVEYLMNAYHARPDTIHGFRGYRILQNNKKIAPYDKWQKCRHADCGNDIMLTGVGGVLYWPGCFHPDITRQDLFMSLTPTSDDLWFKAMTALCGVASHCINHKGQFKKSFIYTNNSIHQPLSKQNKDLGENDKAITNLINHYPGLMTKLHN